MLICVAVSQFLTSQKDTTCVEVLAPFASPAYLPPGSHDFLFVLDLEEHRIRSVSYILISCHPPCNSMSFNAGFLGF